MNGRSDAGDIVVANSGDDDKSTFLGSSGGAFTRVDSSVGDYPCDVTVRGFGTGDENDDIAVLNVYDKTLGIMNRAIANVNAAETWRGQTALMWAAAEGHAHLIPIMIDHGADIGARSVKDSCRMSESRIMVRPTWLFFRDTVLETVNWA